MCLEKYSASTGQVVHLDALASGYESFIISARIIRVWCAAVMTRFGMFALLMPIAGPIGVFFYLIQSLTGQSVMLTGEGVSFWVSVVTTLVAVSLVVAALSLGLVAVIYLVFYLYRKLASGSRAFCLVWGGVWATFFAFAAYLSVADLMVVMPVIWFSGDAFNINATWVSVGDPKWSSVMNGINTAPNGETESQRGAVLSTAFVHVGASIAFLLLTALPVGLVVRGLISRVRHKDPMTDILLRDRNFSDLFLLGFRQIWINIARFIGVFATSRYGKGLKIKIWSLVFLAATVESTVYSGIYEFQKPFTRLDVWTTWGNKTVLSVILQMIAAEVVGVVSLYLFLLLARWLRRSSQNNMIVSLDAVRGDDTRPPILFLRPFKDDQLSLDFAKAPFLVRTLDPASSSDSLEFLILKTLDYIGPLVCIGNPTDKTPPPGAARAYLNNTEWREYVLKLMVDSAFIIVGVDSSYGLMWEIEAIKNHNHVNKTLFVFPPRQASQLSAIQAVLAQFGVQTIPHNILEARTKIVGMFHTTDQRPRFVTTNRLTEIEYELCLRYFISQHEILQ